MNKNIKIMVVIMVMTLIFFTAYTGYNVNKEGKLFDSIESTLYEYFENNNNHIAQYDFDINDTRIRCKGNEAYLVEFDLALNDNKSTKFNKLGATVYKEKDEWQVKGLGNGLVTSELKSYNFQCRY